METYLIIDGILIITAVVIIWRCWAMGLVASVISLLGKVVSYGMAMALSTPIATAIYDQYIRLMLVNNIDKKIESNDIGISSEMIQGAMEFDAAKAEILEKIEQIVESMGLSGILNTSEKSDEFLSSFALPEVSMAEAMVDTFIQPLAVLLVRVCIFFIIFTVMSIGVGIILKIGRGVNYIPVLGGVNHFFGGIIGVVAATVVLVIITMCLATIATITSGTIQWLSWEVLDQTTFFSWIINLEVLVDINIFDLGVV